MRIAILALEQSTPSGVLVVWDMFNMAGRQGGPSGKSSETAIVTLDGKPLVYSEFMEIRPHAAIDGISDADLIVVPSGGYRLSRISGFPEKMKHWISSHHARGSVVAGICTGVFLLAESGILEGKRATTHWAFADVFRKQHPGVDFTPEKLITRDGNIYCSGGGSAGVDLTLHLVETYFGAERARFLSRMFLLERGREGQNPYMDSRFTKSHNDRDILKAQGFMEKRISESILLDDVADHTGMSLRNFKRRFKAATGETPLVYLQKLRMEKAKLILENDDVSIDSLAEKVGYDDIGFFRKLFSRHTGVSPRDYRRRFRNAGN
jgi:transcriptional regulator GlxA family with amidase domain